MQTVKASCPTCGDVVLLPQAFSVTENRGDPELSTYTFRCPKCCEVITKRASFETLGLLAATQGIKWNVVRPPAELSDWRRASGRLSDLTMSYVDDFAIDLGLAPDHLISILAGGGK